MFELAGIGSVDLQASFDLCHLLHRRADPALYLATELLPFQKRPYLHALYAFAKASDDTADEGDLHTRRHAFSEWCAATLHELQTGQSAHPVRQALVHTVNMWGLEGGPIEEFLSATALDNQRSADFITFADLRAHLRGVAGTMATLALPLLEPTGARPLLERLMSLLGEVAQLVENFRDFPIDLEEGRCYLPREDLERFGVVKEELLSRTPTSQLDGLVEYQFVRARRMLDESSQVVSLVHPSSRPFLEMAITGLHMYLDLFSRRKSETLWQSTELLLPATLIGSGGVDDDEQPRRRGSHASRPVARSNEDLVFPTSGASPPLVAPRNVPRHLAVILDGNRRWARAHGRPARAGFSAGWQAVLELVDNVLELGVANLSLFVFSTENWSRPRTEVADLFDLLVQVLGQDLDRLRDKGVRLRWSGRRDRIPDTVRAQVEAAERETRQNDRLTVTICVDYGGRTEIVDAARRLAIDAAAGLIDPSTTGEGMFRNYLYQPELPDVDLLIRTSPERRISNFMLWQLAYAELVFDDVLWPDFGRSHLWRAIEEFVRRDRRMGGTSGEILVTT